MNIVPLVANLLLVVAAGLAAGIVCKRLGVSLLVGYLLVGTLLGAGGFGLHSGEGHDLQLVADLGAMLLLFSIGIEFSLEELLRMRRFFLLGGTLQMILVAAPLIGLEILIGVPWRPAVLLGAAASLSSTVLVFKALEEWGQAGSAAGRRAISILLFQDVAIVPLMLAIPLLTGIEEHEGPPLPLLVLYAAIFVASVPILRWLVANWAASLLASLRSTELVVLFSLMTLGMMSVAAHAAGLPAALGAFAAGMILNGNRLSNQIDAVILPFRETFAAVFFVSLGTLMQFGEVFEAPLISLLGVAATLMVKTGAAAVALRLLGLAWRPALGMGLGLSQLGELSFLLLSQGLRSGLLTEEIHNRMLFIALSTLVLTPQLLRTGLRWAGDQPSALAEPSGLLAPVSGAAKSLVIGLGPIGSQVASRMEIAGLDVCLIDLSPVNLHRYAQQGFRTVAGDASDPDVLGHADAAECRIAVVTVPDDRAALLIVAAIRALNAQCTIVVRCRYQANVARVRRAGADTVVSEEAEASGAILRVLDPLGKASTGDYTGG